MILRKQTHQDPVLSLKYVILPFTKHSALRIRGSRNLANIELGHVHLGT